MSRYQDIMHHLNPRVIIEKVDLPHDSARGTYSLDSSIAGSYREFEQTVIEYLDHHMEETVGSSLPDDYLLDKARKLLDSAGGFDNAAFIALSGTDGGMVKVLNDLAEGCKQESKNAYFQYIVDSFISPLDFSERVEVMAELKDTLGAYTPSSFQYIEPEAMAADYKRILSQYIDSLTKYKNLWAY